MREVCVSARERMCMYVGVCMRENICVCVGGVSEKECVSGRECMCL